MEKKYLACIYKETKKFSMYKQWGEGDERLLPIYPEYQNTIIRWGKEEAIEEAILEVDSSLIHSVNISL